uniref:Uncharacterized protein n=1 Tax=Sonderella linearis TaxID=110477 RepID=A0A1Z1MM97_9FLOR|nr:hypothetical protein [Sonderella linearis]ARW66982.1 hypothetical protein [Sonderella linearis]
MNFYIYPFYRFHVMCIIPIYKIQHLTHQSIDLIPIHWQMILINTGSFTQTIISLTGQKIIIQASQKKYNQYKQISKIIRCVWLETTLYTKITFARSLWILLHNIRTHNIINIKKAMGQSLIKYKIDTYKQIHELYYAYSKNIERQFKHKHNLWGRKYTLYYDNKSYITIQEFFSPKIKKLFS